MAQTNVQAFSGDVKISGDTVLGTATYRKKRDWNRNALAYVYLGNIQTLSTTGIRLDVNIINANSGYQSYSLQINLQGDDTNHAGGRLMFTAVGLNNASTLRNVEIGYVFAPPSSGIYEYQLWLKDPTTNVQGAMSAYLNCQGFYNFNTGISDIAQGSGAPTNFQLGVPTVVCDASGNVGIGTAIPGEKLVVHENISTSGHQIVARIGGDTSSFNTLVFGSSVGRPHVGGHRGDYGAWADLSLQNDTMVVKEGTGVGIGTATPGQKLHLYANQDNVGASIQNNARKYTIGVRGDTSDNFAIVDDTANAFRIRLSSAGALSVGAHTAIHTLDVNGSAGFRGVTRGFRFTTHYHNTGSINSARNYDMSTQNQFQQAATNSTVALVTGWYLCTAQRGDGNPFESASGHFYKYTQNAQRFTAFGNGGISFGTSGQNLRLVISNNANNFPTPYAIHLCKIGLGHAMAI